MLNVHRKYAGVLVLALCFLGGCATTTNDNDLRTRAAFDLQCEGAKLQIVDIDDRTRGVSGCGQRASYVKTELPPTWTEPAKEAWVKNSETSPESAKQ